MASPFPPWSDTALRVGVFAAFATVAGLVAAPMIWVRAPWARRQLETLDQPVQFDHRHHVQDDGIDCRYCHRTVDRAATAGMPPTDLCMGCHNQVWNQSPMLEMVRRSYFSGAPIPWNRVHRLPDFVYFNHAIHVNAGVGCVTCHGRVDRMAGVYQEQTLTMGFCLGCHRAPESSLRPASAITDMRWKPEEEGKANEELSRRLGGRRPTHCTACHR